MHIFISYNRRVELFWSKTFNRYSEFHVSLEAIIRQMPEKRLQSEIYEKLRTIHTACGACRVLRDATVSQRKFPRMSAARYKLISIV